MRAIGCFVFDGSDGVLMDICNRRWVIARQVLFPSGSGKLSNCGASLLSLIAAQYRNDESVALRIVDRGLVSRLPSKSQNGCNNIFDRLRGIHVSVVGHKLVQCGFPLNRLHVEVLPVPCDETGTGGKKKRHPIEIYIQSAASQRIPASEALYYRCGK